MEQKLKVSEASQKVLNWAMWFIFAIFLMFIASVTTTKAETTVKTEVSGKNPYLKKYQKKQKSMEFKGFKKRKQWKNLRKK